MNINWFRPSQTSACMLDPHARVMCIICAQASIPLSTDLHQLEIMLGGDTGLRGGIDIFAGPPQPIGGRVGGSVASPSSSRREAERNKMGNEDDEAEGDTQRGTYTMYDEYGDPGERSREMCFLVVWNT